MKKRLRNRGRLTFVDSKKLINPVIDEVADDKNGEPPQQLHDHGDEFAHAFGEFFGGTFFGVLMMFTHMNNCIESNILCFFV